MPSIRNWPRSTEWQSYTFTINFLNWHYWSLETDFFLWDIASEAIVSIFQYTTIPSFLESVWWSESVSALQAGGCFRKAPRSLSLITAEKQTQSPVRRRVDKEDSVIQCLYTLLQLNLYRSPFKLAVIFHYFKLKCWASRLNNVNIFYRNKKWQDSVKLWVSGFPHFVA